jgi:hypothetical protein
MVKGLGKKGRVKRIKDEVRGRCPWQSGASFSPCGSGFPAAMILG